MKNFIIILFLFIIIILGYLNYKNINIFDKGLKENIKKEFIENKINTGNITKTQKIINTGSIIKEKTNNLDINKNSKSLNNLPENFSDL